jgi:hypothetical protein
MSEINNEGLEKSFDCPYQEIRGGSLICNAAVTDMSHTTNIINLERNCYKCDVYKIYQEVGCNAFSPKLVFFKNSIFSCIQVPKLSNIICTKTKKETTLTHCQTCSLPNAETTQKITSVAKGLFKAHGFISALEDLQNAQNNIRDGEFKDAIENSSACLESVMRICHELLEKDYPKQKNLSEKYKSTNEILNLNNLDELVVELLGKLREVTNSLGRVRNNLTKVHGGGLIPPEVSVLIAELAINTASTLSTAIVRRYVQIKSKSD